MADLVGQAYVFGMDVPVLESLFILLIVLFAALIFIFLELRKLNKIVSKETSHLDRFEDDLQMLEKGKGTKDLTAFVKDVLKKGFSKEEVIAKLKKAGWDQKSIDVAVKAA